jgi:hypothetical protein
MMVPVVRIIILRTVSKSQLVDALAWLTIPALIGPQVGPPIGGFITTYFDWRWIFWMNIPIGLLGIALATRLMPNTLDETVPPLDLRGFLLSALGLPSMVFGFTIVGRDLLPGYSVLALIVFGGICLALYASHALSIQEPILDLRLLRIQSFRAGVVGGSFYRVGVGAIENCNECLVLRRHRPERRQQGHDPLQGGPTDFPFGRRCGFGLHPGIDAVLARQPEHCGKRFFNCVSSSYRGGLVFGFAIPVAWGQRGSFGSDPASPRTSSGNCGGPRRPVKPFHKPDRICSKVRTLWIAAAF